MALLERDPLLDAVEERLVAVPSDGGALGMIAGEAGVGKTSLVEAICRRWSGRLPVWRGGCDALGTATEIRDAKNCFGPRRGLRCGLVEPRGIEPLTSAVRLQRSPI